MDNLWKFLLAFCKVKDSGRDFHPKRTFLYLDFAKKDGEKRMKAILKMIG